MNSFLRGLRRFSETLFGAWEIQWSPPDWIEESGDCIEDHPKIAAAVLWLAILGGGFGIWSFFQSPPEVPDALAVAIEAPGLASVKKDENGKSYLKPSPLKITFDQSAAPLDQLPNETEGESAPPVSGIRLEPAVNGLWRWVNDQTLHFDPTEDWLPDRNYQILWDEADLVAEGRQLPTPKGPEFATKPFTAAVEKQSFYQNPRDPSVKQGVVTLRFSHGVAQNSLRSRTTIEVLGEEALFDPSQEEALQEIVFHDFDRMATLRTAPLILPTEESFLQFTIQPGISPALGSSRTEEPMESRVKIPSVYTHFQISSARVLSRRNEKGEPFPALQIKTSSLIEPASFHPALTLHLLPPFEEPDTWPEGEVKPTAWTLDTLTDEILAQADPLSLTADTIPSSGPSSTRQVTYDFPHQPEGRQLIVQVPAETQALGGYRLKEDFQTLLDVPEGPREVHLLGRFGGVLALTGDRKITIKSRNLSTLKVRLGRVPVGQINHLVSQTGGDFRTPYFKNYSFDETNFAHFAEELQPVFPRNSFEANYNSIDLTRFLGMEDPLDPDPSRGLYFLRAYGWNAAENERQYSGGQEGDQAFLLVTDLGIIAKRNEDSTRDVFVQSLADGSPVSGAEVQILSKNGTPLVTSSTDAEGRAQLAAVDQSLQDERKPVAIIVRKGTDLSFLPLDRYQRRLSYSRFDTRGISAPTPSDLDGFLFNERGIYRPGETIHSGVIIKPRDWAGRLEDLPIKVTVQDPRNRTILESILSLPESGFLDFSTPTEPSYATGRYKLRAYLVHPEDEDGHQESDTLLASSSVRVEEFLPDTMTVKAELSPAPESGWLTSRDLTVSVQADNLVGTPAVDRKILGQITATPSRFAFDDFPGYVFFDRNLKHARASSWETKEGKTSDTGAYDTSLDLSKLAAATYRLRYEAKVFEPGSGRNVRGISQSVVVSPLQQAVGYKPEGGLRYIPRGTEATVSLVAVNPQVQRIPLSNLSVRVIETYHASILKQQSGGDYAYESVKRERDVSQSTLSIPRENPATFTLPTENPGEFRVSL
ncbi:MAG: MG2 domain-containing protein, partial [Verrucomicrobiota bacterium]